MSVSPGLLWIEVAAIAAIAVGTIAVLPSDGRLLAAGLLAVAVAPWVAEARGVTVPPGVRSVCVLAAVGALSLGARRWDIAVRSGQDQLALLIVVWLAARTMVAGSLRWGAVTAVCATAITAGRAAIDPDYQAAVIWTVAVVAATLAGLAGRVMLGALAELQRTQAELAESTAATERHRIAREVHDVVAHSLTVTMLDVTAARMAILRGEPDEAIGALEEAEETGRRSLADIRRVVRLLRSRDDPDQRAPVSAADISRLVEDYRGAAMEVRADLAADLDGLTSAADLTLYRIAQESLANVARHAPGAAVDVVLRRADDVVSLEVRSSSGAATDTTGSGLGILGMKERAQAVGGWCEAGPAPPSAGGGWVVRCEIPTGSRVAG